MIDEDWTQQLFGYTSDELKTCSGKPVVAVCEDCGGYRVLPKRKYADLCHSCSTHLSPSPETRKRMAAGSKGNTNASGCVRSSETLERMSKSGEGRIFSPAHRRNLSLAAENISDETRIKMSAAKQGISVDEWQGFARDGIYCHNFNDTCREKNRDKYGRACFLCGKDETENGRRLSVHHVDMSKSQGCDGEKWKLVPLCQSCHSCAHSETWKSRIEYLLRG